jgi:aminopeptidase-like protein
MPFIDNNIPAILTIDNDWGDYPSYHRSSDTIDKVSRDMGAAILRMNAAALAGMLSIAP